MPRHNPDPVFLKALTVGSKVTRWLGGAVPMPLTVSAVTEETITCAEWVFSRRNGAEIDEELGWGENETGSFIMAPDPKS